MTRRAKATEYRAGKGSDVTVRLVNPDTRRWEIEQTLQTKLGPDTKVYEVPDWQLEDMVTVNLAPRFAQAKSLMARVRRDLPATVADRTP